MGLDPELVGVLDHHLFRMGGCFSKTQGCRCRNMWRAGRKAPTGNRRRSLQVQAVPSYRSARRLHFDGSSVAKKDGNMEAFGRRCLTDNDQNESEHGMVRPAYSVVE